MVLDVRTQTCLNMADRASRSGHVPFLFSAQNQISVHQTNFHFGSVNEKYKRSVFFLVFVLY